jgi:hypothetical protein
MVGCDDFSRHGGAATALLKGISLATGQKILGHDRPQTTAIYLRTSTAKPNPPGDGKRKRDEEEDNWQENA